MPWTRSPFAVKWVSTTLSLPSVAWPFGDSTAPLLLVPDRYAVIGGEGHADLRGNIHDPDLLHPLDVAFVAQPGDENGPLFRNPDLGAKALPTESRLPLESSGHHDATSFVQRHPRGRVVAGASESLGREHWNPRFVVLGDEDVRAAGTHELGPGHLQATSKRADQDLIAFVVDRHCRL